MDTMEYAKERQRLCDSYIDCNNCPLNNFRQQCDDISDLNTLSKVIQIVENWTKENPKITVKEKYLSIFPEADLDICPRYVNSNMDCPDYVDTTQEACNRCKKEFWDSEYRMRSK